MVRYIYTNLPVNAIVGLPHPRRGDSQGQEAFLAPSAKNTFNLKLLTISSRVLNICSTEQ